MLGELHLAAVAADAARRRAVPGVAHQLVVEDAGAGPVGPVGREHGDRGPDPAAAGGRAQVCGALVGDGGRAAHGPPVAHVQPGPVQPADAARRVAPRHPGAELDLGAGVHVGAGALDLGPHAPQPPPQRVRRAGLGVELLEEGVRDVDVDTLLPARQQCERHRAGPPSSVRGADLLTRLPFVIARWPAVNEIVDVAAFGPGTAPRTWSRAATVAAAPRRPRAAARRRRPRASARRSRPSRWPCAGCRRAAGGSRRGPTNAGCTSLRLWWRRLGHGSGKKIRIPASEASGTCVGQQRDGVAAQDDQVGQPGPGPHEQRRDAGLEDLDGEVVDVGLGRRQRGRRLAHARADLQDQRGSPGRTRRAGRSRGLR